MYFVTDTPTNDDLQTFSSKENLRYSPLAANIKQVKVCYSNSATLCIHHFFSSIPYLHGTYIVFQPQPKLVTSDVKKRPSRKRKKRSSDEPQKPVSAYALFFRWDPSIIQFRIVKSPLKPQMLSQCTWFIELCVKYVKSKKLNGPICAESSS